jgi:hypothetical protein
MNIEIGKIQVSHIRSKYQLVGEGKISFQGWGGGDSVRLLKQKTNPSSDINLTITITYGYTILKLTPLPLGIKSVIVMCNRIIVKLLARICG